MHGEKPPRLRLPRAFGSRAAMRLGWPLLFVACAPLLAPASGEAQQTWRQPSNEMIVGLDLVVPSYANQEFDAVEATGTFVLPIREDQMTLVTGMSLGGARVPDLGESVVVSNVYGSLQLRGEGGFLTRASPIGRGTR